jgi:hypothetical protein
LHEQSHIDNNDKDVYWLNSKDLLTPDKIAIEVRATVDALEKITGKTLKQPTSEVRFKDKEERLKLEYPKEIEGIPSEFLTEYVEKDFGTEEDNLTWEDDADLEQIEKQYGKAVTYLLDEGHDVTKKQAEWLKSKGEDAVRYIDELISFYPEDDSNFYEVEPKGVAKWLLDQNEKITDTAQMSLFDPNNEDLEGADEPNPCGQ